MSCGDLAVSCGPDCGTSLRVIVAVSCGDVAVSLR